MTKHILIQSNGRSGSNILLDTMDLAASTHCRNEPDQLPGGALARLGDYRFFVDDPAALAGVWDGAILDGAFRIGPRDHPVRNPKDWLYRGTWKPGIKYIYARYRAVHYGYHLLHYGLAEDDEAMVRAARRAFRQALG